MWGQDLSGTMTKAGGVGGLLMVNISGTNCFATYDGNGNITALINAVDKSLTARYEYSPYGELLRTTGQFARQNPFRFSSKFWDEESGLLYYGCRYYSAAFGKWIGRDPTTDQIFLNLYLFCHNNPIIRYDTLGDMDYENVMWLQMTIRTTLEATLSHKGVGDALKLMFKWFQEGGDYDFKTKPPLEGFDIGGPRQLKKDEFGNYIAGYAAGVAFLASGDIDFLAGVYAGGASYRLRDAAKGYCTSVGDFFSRWIGQINMIDQGLIQGVSDELDAEISR